MPKKFRRDFRVGHIVAHVRQKSNGVFEIRCQINKKPVYASAKLLETAKNRFIAALAEVENKPSTETALSPQKADFAPIPPAPEQTPKMPEPPAVPTIGEYMLKWIEIAKKPIVKEITMNSYLQTYRVHILPALGNRRLNAISAFDLQEFVDSYSDAGRNRTAKKIYQLLRAMFEYAVADDIIEKSPMKKVILQRYEQKGGTALSREEEGRLVALLKNGGDVYVQALVFLLYTGLRRSELASVSLSDDGWITVTTSKQRKGYREKTRSLPVSPMLAAVLPYINLPAVLSLKLDTLTRKIKEHFPSRHLHETRHTFITRCQECGIQRELVSLWSGHTADNSTTTRVYTHLEQNRERQKEEMKKFFYPL